VELVPHMLDQVGLKIQKHQFRSQMHLPLKNVCETSWCLVGNRWSNDESNSVIAVIIITVSRRRWSYCARWCKHAWSNRECTESKTSQEWLVCWTSYSVGQKHTSHLSSPMLASLRRIDASLVEEQGHLSWTPTKRDIYHRWDSITYGAHNH
jgi:hypothetical protein